MEILAQAAERPVGAVPGLAIVLVVGVVVVALTGLSRSLVAERGTDRRLLRAERKGREQVEEGFREAIVLRLVDLTPDPEATSGEDGGDASEAVDLTEAEQIDLATSIDLTVDDAEDALGDDARPAAD